MKRERGETVENVLYVLEECGPMTREEIGRHLDIPKRQLSPVISRMSKDSPRAGKRIHVTQYIYDQEGQRRYPRAVFAIGDRPDAAKPERDIKGAKQRYNARLKARHTANFVFNLALPRRVYQNRTAA